MNSDSEHLKKRFRELAAKSDSGLYYTFTDFLGLSEMSDFSSVKGSLPGVHTVFGGASGTERCMIRFGNPEEIGYDVPFPIKCIKIEPRSAKFAERLTHRDLLGAILNLGIERCKIGDIAIREDASYVFASEEIAPVIINELLRVRHTDVKLKEAESLPEGELYRTEAKNLQVAGERADAIIARVYNLSRSDSLALFKRGLVFIGGVECQNNSRALKEGEVVSVRGYGRFVYRGYSSLTKKGRLNIAVEVYI